MAGVQPPGRVPRWPWAAVLLVCLGVHGACASAPVRRADPVNLDAADAKRRDGCFDCLIEARDDYRRAAVGVTRPVALLRWFETELLIALRETELGLDSSETMARARAIVPELPPAVGADRYLYNVSQIPHAGAGWTRREASEFRASHLGFAKTVDAELEWIRAGSLDPIVREYLTAALNCAYLTRQRVPGEPVGPASQIQPPGTPPLVRYRQAICGRLQGPVLESVRAEVPRFVETSYFLGLIALTTLSQGSTLNPHVLTAEVQKRFPESPAVTFLGGAFYQAIADCEQAIPFFERTIAIKPGHEDAWLGRTICFTDLLRHEEAIATATRMIELALDNTDQALYWRAWNRHARAELAMARADIDAARVKRITSDILTLAGVIEHDQDELVPAERDLTRAITISQGPNCRALWFLGSVFVKRESWRDAAPAFDRAMTCLDEDARDREKLLAGLEGNPALDAEYRRRQAARLRDQIASQRRQQSSAAFNAANFYYASGNLERARTLIEVAARAPELAAEVESLRKAIADLTASRRVGAS